jgi:predicted transcriptional regulator
MTLVTVRVPSELIADLEEVAQRRNEPKTALVRMALEDYLSTPKNRRRKAS